jgi:hypothetical protein
MRRQGSGFLTLQWRARNECCIRFRRTEPRFLARGFPPLVLECRSCAARASCLTGCNPKPLSGSTWRVLCAHAGRAKALLPIPFGRVRIGGGAVYTAVGSVKHKKNLHHHHKKSFTYVILWRSVVARAPTLFVKLPAAPLFLMT